jgi:UDP-galactopyranose mutase
MFVVIIIDYLWKLGNSVIFQNKQVNLQEFPQKVAKSYEENSRAYNSSYTQIPNTGFTAMQQWIKHPLGKIKINVDAAIGELQACCADVIRNLRSPVNHHGYMQSILSRS